MTFVHYHTLVKIPSMLKLLYMGFLLILGPEPVISQAALVWRVCNLHLLAADAESSNQNVVKQ